MKWYRLRRSEKVGLTFLATLLFLVVVLRVLILPKWTFIENSVDIIDCTDELMLEKIDKQDQSSVFFNDTHSEKQKNKSENHYNLLLKGKKEKRNYSNKRVTDITPKISLNKITENQLVTARLLPDFLAKRVVKYRTLLGGFYSYEQLYDVYGIDTIYIDYWKRKTFLDTANIKKINLNTANLNELSFHPYISNYEAKSILTLREYKNKFSDVSDLLLDNVVDSSLINKITPYLSFN